MLEQIFSMEGSKVVSNYFGLLAKSKKISELSVSNESIRDLTQEQQLRIAKKLIQYYGLDQIEDWVENDYGFESYRAKIQIYCHVESFENSYSTLNLGITPLGQYRSRNYQSIIRPGFSAS